MREVDLHWVRLDVDPRRYSALLSPDERERAARFRFDRDRARFTVCRGTLREVLSKMLAIPAAEIEFTYRDHGKPETEGLHFNVSHSAGLAVVAVSKTRAVGVDVECMNRVFAQERIPERFFAPSEVRALRSLPQADQLEMFFRIWTRKEAYIKALGEGLSHPLNGFDALAEIEGWEIESLAAPDGFAAALCAART